MKSKRNAFTLVELLVVIAIIGVLIALLLPAVQAAREAARRIQCANHCKQIGIAVHNFHDVNRFLPDGGRHWGNAPVFVNGRAAVGRQQLAGWGMQILPYMEQENLYDGTQGASDEAKIIALIGTPIDTYFCPSRGRPRVFTHTTQNWYDPRGARTHAQTDYAGSNLHNHGAIIRNDGTQGEITFAAITDGTSNTLLIGEKRLNRARLNVFQGDDNEGYTSGWDHDVMRRTDRQPAKDPMSGTGDQRFGSSHPGGFNVVLADASVTHIPYTIQLATFRDIGQRNDGRTVDIP